ncbi:phorbol-12-myristate-13-acetate-induced protein 1 [Ambystoma mexicanum]|uniref:phorbol-12-myristate-13-acetate-induced protein 1 n=1 Tax=Ambystoma mexicanum TaxID=8296 RepID=UPI0037E929FF
MSKAFSMIPTKKPRKAAPKTEAMSAADVKAVVDCALQLQQIGDRMDLRQKILNAISKLLCPGT